MDIESMSINNTGTYMSNTSNTLSSLKAQNDAIASMEGIDPKMADLGRKLSLEQAKRLLAIASIRPSKTFHKLMTEEEMDALTKYYNLIKPKASLSATQIAANAAAQQAAENMRCASHPPITYQSAKVNLSSLRNLQSFIDTYKKEIDSGRLTVDYDLASDPKGFVLKDQTDQSVIKFPQELNDSFFALAVTHGDQENKTLSEANLYRIVNWNDTSASCFTVAEKKKSKAAKNSLNAPKQEQQQQTTMTVVNEFESSGSPRDSPRDTSSKSSLKENSLKDGSTNESNSNEPLVSNNHTTTSNTRSMLLNMRRIELDMIEAETASQETSSSRGENDETTVDDLQSNEQINSSENLATANIMVNLAPKKKKKQQMQSLRINNSSSTHLHSVHFSDLDTRSGNSSTGDISKNCENSKSTLTNNNNNNNSTTMNENSTLGEFENVPANNSKFKYSSSSYVINNQQSSAINSSALSFDYIKSLSSLVNSIIEPKLLKQLTNSGVDVR
jgi:hypothetical protein